MQQAYTSPMEETETAASALTSSTTFQLGVLGAHWAARLLESVSDLELNQKQLGILVILSQGAASSQDDIARLMNVSPSLVVKVVDTLESRSLLSRSRDPKNRRRHKLELTEQGYELLAQVNAAARVLDREIREATGARAGASLDTGLLALMTTLPSL